MHFGATRFGARKMWGQKTLYGVVASLILGLMAVSLAVPLMAQTQSYRFSGVRVEGNQRVDPATVVNYARITPGAAVSSGQLNDALQRVQNSGLFESVDLVPSGSTLVIRVKEYPTISVINFEGNKRLKDEDLQKLITSKPRRVYSPAQAEADAALVAQAYNATGRSAVTVTPVIIRRSENRVDLAFEIQEGRPVEIERLNFNGNRAYSDRRLRQVLSTRQAGLFRKIISSDSYDEDRIAVDKQLLSDFYLARGYVDFEVLDTSAQITPQRDGTFLTFTVREGTSYRFGRLSTVSEIPEVSGPEFARQMKIRSGVTYSPTIVEHTIERMENLAISKGLTFVAVEPRVTKNERTQTLDIQFTLTRGPRVFVERIDIEGNTTTRDDVIRREFKAAEGDPFNPREIRRAAERIRALGYFSDAKVDSQPGSAPDQVIVNVDVTEQPTGSLSFGASYGADTGLGLAVGFSEDNFLGRGQSVAVNINTASKNQDASFRFVEPYFLGRELALSLGAGFTQTDNLNSSYATQVATLSAGLGFPIAENARLDFSYEINQSQVRSVDANSSNILKLDQALGKPIASIVGYQFSYDTRTEGLNPLGGVLLRFGQRYAGIGGSRQFLQSSGLALAERKVLREEATIRAVFEGGVTNSLDGDSRVTERFFGNGKIRGFEANGIGPRDLAAPNRDPLGGNAFAVARFESEFPIGLPAEYKIKGGLFADFGSVWSLDNASGGVAGGQFVDDKAHLRSAIGVSFFWDTALGPLRFNFAKALKKEDYDRTRFFDLQISTKF